MGVVSSRKNLQSCKSHIAFYPLSHLQWTSTGTKQTSFLKFLKTTQYHFFFRKLNIFGVEISLRFFIYIFIYYIFIYIFIYYIFYIYFYIYILYIFLYIKYFIYIFFHFWQMVVIATNQYLIAPRALYEKTYNYY